jgi:hypothetical protein
MSWHLDHELLTLYHEGHLSEVAAFSVEAHLVGCDRCRRLTSDAVDTDRREHIWEGVIDLVDRPTPHLAEKVLAWFGVPAHAARLLALTPSVRPAWVASVLTVLVLAVVLSPNLAGGPLLFLVIAPLVPMSGIAVTFGHPIDPLYEVGLATPTGGFRLLLVRASAVLATSAALTAIPAWALTEFRWMVVWLLPALVTTVLTLIVSSVTSVAVAAGVVSAVWIGGVMVTAVSMATPYAVFSARAQVAFAGLALGLAGLLVTRRQAFERQA